MVYTDHDDHESLDTPSDPSRLVLISQPVKSSSHRRIFFRLSLSFTVTGQLPSHASDTFSLHHGIVPKRMTENIISPLPLNGYQTMFLLTLGAWEGHH